MCGGLSYVHKKTTLQLNDYGTALVVAEDVFYLLRVGSSNDLVLYNELLKCKTKNNECGLF